MIIKGELTTEVKVTFSDPAKAKAVFIDGDWKGVFWPIEDMEELTKDLVHTIHQQPELNVFNEETNESQRQKQTEGFGTYIKNEGHWVMDSEETGKISVFIGDLSVESTYEDEQ